MPGTISIRATPLLKFVLPPVWLVAVAYALRLLWSGPQPALGDFDPTVALLLRLILTALVAASLIVLIRFVLPLKRVRLMPDGLLVSNYVREIAVPFSAIESARQRWLPTFRLVTLVLRADAGLGRRVLFMPAVPMPVAVWRKDYWREDEVVRELRALSASSDSR